MTLNLKPSLIEALHTMGNRLRRDALEATTAAGSGHPTSSMSCADLLAVLFFHVMRFDVANPKNPLNDRFILSKGHAAPALWSAWAEAGAFPVERLKTLRQIGSDLEGHPTPRNAWVDVATGSLGQGLSAGVGMALASRLDGLHNRVYVLLGDGESAEGSVWEAAELASYYHLDHLTAIVDVNRLGQSQETMYGHDLGVYARRFEAFGWQALTIDGHNIEEIIEAFDKAQSMRGRPTAIIARTVKGKGVALLEGQDGWHGKAVSPEDLQRALDALGHHFDLEEPLRMHAPVGDAPEEPAPPSLYDYPGPDYKPGEAVATRQAYGKALDKLGRITSHVVALDGDVKNSTFSELFDKEFPDRFVECFIAEQNMIGAAVGLSARGKIPYASTFACFLTRAYDQIRMAAISQANLKLCGSHAGISIGEDGPSQMALEDLAMMRAVEGSTVLYPCDAVSAERLTALAAVTPGIVYLRTSRPKTEVIYGPQEEFHVGGCKVLRESAGDRATIVAAGVTLHEALKAHEELLKGGINVRVIDLYSVKPLDGETLRRAARETGAIVTVEDHYPEGGLGEAVLGEVAGLPCRCEKLAVYGLPRSGQPEELMAMFQIDAQAIVQTVRRMIEAQPDMRPKDADVMV